MKNPVSSVSLDNIARGAAIERFAFEFQKVLDNIADPNTTDGKRSIKLEITLKPSKERDHAEVNVSCSSKLAPAEAFSSSLFIVRDRDGVRAYEKDTGQTDLFAEKEKPENIVEIK